MASRAWQNLGYFKRNQGLSVFTALCKASHCTAHLKTTKPFHFLNEKLLPLNFHYVGYWKMNCTSTCRGYSTNSNFFSRRKEFLILIIAGIGAGAFYGWTKKLENDKRDKEMEELDKLIKVAQESSSRGTTNEVTTKLYKKALERVKYLINLDIKSNQRMSILTTKFVFIIDQIANLLHSLGKLNEAEDYYKQTIQALISHGTKQDDDTIIELSLKLASIYAEQQRHELAENGFTWCVNNQRKKVNENKRADKNSLALLGICLESYGKYRISRKDPNKAISIFTEALVISRTVFGPKHQQVFLLLNNLAVAYHETGDTDQAKKFFKEAIDLAGEEKSVDLWSFHFNLANVLVQTGESESGMLEYDKAIELCQDEEIKSKIQDRMSKQSVL